MNLFGPAPSDKAYQKYVSSVDIITAVRLLNKSLPEVTFMCTGLSTFGSLGAEIGAGMDEKCCCTGCYSCFKLMDPGHTMTGCIVRDQEIYLSLYQKHVLKK